MPETIVGGGDYCGRLVLPKSSVAFSPPHGGLLFSTLNLIHKLPLAYSSVVFLNSVPRSHIAHCLVEGVQNLLHLLLGCSYFLNG